MFELSLTPAVRRRHTKTGKTLPAEITGGDSGGSNARVAFRAQVFASPQSGVCRDRAFLAELSLSSYSYMTDMGITPSISGLPGDVAFSGRLPTLLLHDFS